MKIKEELKQIEYKEKRQKWMLMKVTWEYKEIKIQEKKPEFLEWKLIDVENLTEVVVDFKLHVYKEIKEKISRIINWLILKLQLFDLLNI